MQQNGEPDWQMLSWFYDRHDYQHGRTWKVVGEQGGEGEGEGSVSTTVLTDED